MAELFELGDFTLASGLKSNWKIECDALGDREWQALAWMLMDYLPRPFFKVVGVPRGGVPLAKAMQRFVDTDVQRLETAPLMRAVAFARNPVPPDVTALFSVPA